MFTETDQKTILVVDDDQATRETYAELFRNNNFKVLEAQDGVEGLDIITSKEQIDLVFTGIIMPRMDGFQLISALKENAVTAKIPVIINSHLGREDDRKRAQELGVKDFIIRGIVLPSEVVQRIKASLSSGNDYYLQVDPFALNGQEMIADFGLPEDFRCANCGSNLSAHLIKVSQGSLSAKIECPDCKKVYL